MSDRIIDITDASFETDVLNAPCAVLVDFYADWCGPCKMLDPILSELADEYGDQLRVVKLCANDNTLQVERLTVRGLPSLLLFIGGEERGRLVGGQSKSRLFGFIEQHLEA